MWERIFVCHSCKEFLSKERDHYPQYVCPHCGYRVVQKEPTEWDNMDITRWCSGRFIVDKPRPWWKFWGKDEGHWEVK